MSTGKRSAGLLLFRVMDTANGPDAEVLLGHMGGPFWARREEAAWSVPKGEYTADEEPEAAARREFTEELGLPLPEGVWVPLGEVRQAGGKTVTVWAVEGEVDPGRAVPGTFTMEWPRGSGVQKEFPEMDRFAWCTPAEAAERLVVGQRAFLDRLRSHLRGEDTPPAQGLSSGPGRTP
ncbi:NUDIX domain-containing protein [Streptomyces sp. NPDC048560]|uniref:NUDIX domain-containing protein n=1 Tax=Streptomyces sp. NPDC048560 TaxID=3155488 RepID=UPI003441884C